MIVRCAAIGATGLVALLTVLPALAEEPFAADVGFEGSPNFSVFAPQGDNCATKVCRAADAYRRRIAIDWLGRELAAGKQYTHIYVRFTEAEDVVTILGNPQRAPHDNHMYLHVKDADAAVGEALAHEMAHVVTRSLFPRSPPHWVMEGIACGYDGPQARAPRLAFLSRQLDAGRLPAIRKLLDGKAFPPSDVPSYSVAESLTNFLLTRGDRQQFVEFAQVLSRDGVDAALDVYGIDTVDQLQSAWEQWVRRKNASLPGEKSR